MKTTVKISDYQHKYQSPEIGCFITGLNGVLCSSLTGASVEDLNTVQDQSTWENLY